MRHILILLMLLIAVPCSTFAQEQEGGSTKKFGLGVIVGEPTGISAKYYLSEKNAIDGAVAWSIRNDWVYMHGDYLFIRHPFDVKTGSVPVHFGPGISTAFGDDDVWMGARFEAGIGYQFEEVPVEAFIEIAPVLGLIPDVGFGLQGDIGVRYYF